MQPGGVRTAIEPAEDIESLLVDGAYALHADGDLRAARTRFEAAFRSAERIGDTQAIAEAALGLCGLWVHEHRTSAGAAQVRERLRHALSLVDPMSSLALRLRIRLAAEADYRAGTHTAIDAMLDEARRSGDPLATADALGLAHHCRLGPEHGPSRLALAEELVGESFRTTRRADLLMGLLRQAVDLFLGADPRAERRLGELRDLLARQDHLAAGFVVNAIDVLLAVRAGRLDDAETLAYRCAERGAAAGDIDATGWYCGHLFAIRWYQGRVAELLPMFDELAHSPTLSVVDNSFFAAVALSAASAGDRRKAAGALATLCGRDLADLPRSSTWLVTMSGIVETAYLLADRDTAARAYTLLGPFAHLPMIASLGVACFGSVHHPLGVAALTMGRPDVAAEHFRAAIRANTALAHWPAVILSRVRYAQALAQLGRPTDELATAAEEAEALGIALPEHAEPAPAATCVRAGRMWRVARGRRDVTVNHSVGMLHLAALLASPGTEIQAVDLVAGLVTLDRPASGQPVLDGAAMREYRRRLSDLRAAIDDPDRADDARAERDRLITEVVGATGFTDDGERARITVGKTIRRAIAQVADADAELGRHLAQTVHTGIRCGYRPG